MYVDDGSQKEARARQKARRHRHKTGQVLADEQGEVVEEVVSGDEEEQVNHDQQVIDEPDLAKPDKPESSFGPEARERIVAKFQEIRRLPGKQPWSHTLLHTVILCSGIKLAY